MKKRLQHTMLLLGLIMSISMCGQVKQAIIWNSFQFPVTLNSKWQMHNDISYRTIGASLSAYQYSYRTAIRRIMKNRWSTAAGFAFFYTRLAFDKIDHEFSHEFRLWQEIVKGNLVTKRFSIINRLRTEERFIAPTSLKEKYFALRFLYKLSFVESLSPKWKLQLADEYMEQLTGDKLAFQQNRLSIAAIFLINKSTQFQTGYLRGTQPSITQNNIIFTFQKIIANNEHKHKG